MLLKVIIIFILTFGSSGKNYSNLNEQELESKILSHLDVTDYQPTVRPPPIYDNSSLIVNKEHQPVIIKINIFIVGFSSISVANNDFTMDIIVRQEWIDKRLIINHSFNFLSIGYLKNRLWTPDLFFKNSKKSSTHEVTKPNHLIWLYPNGTLKYSQKLTVTLFCDMNLWNFPLDTQMCSMELGSYGYAIEDLQFIWWTVGKVQPVSLKEPMHLNEFYQPKIGVYYCHSFYEISGNFSCLQANFTLQRKFGFYLIYTYIPSIFIVSISWISFFIDYKAVPARITLGLLALLALMTQSSSVVEKLPRVSYVKAIDIWMFSCLAFVISSLFEFAVVNCLSRYQEKTKMKQKLQKVVRSELLTMSASLIRQSSNYEMSPSNTGTNLQDINENETKLTEDNLSNLLNENMSANFRTNKKSKWNRFQGIKARSLDTWFSLWFPVFFLIFNTFYWYIFTKL